MQSTVIDLASSPSPPSPGAVNCAICLSENVPSHNKALVLQCLHPFCTTCIEAWAQRSRACPLCKGNMEAYLTNITSDVNFQEVRLPPLPAPTRAPLGNSLRGALHILEGLPLGMPENEAHVGEQLSAVERALRLLAGTRASVESWDRGRREGVGGAGRLRPRGLVFGAPPPGLSQRQRDPEQRRVTGDEVLSDTDEVQEVVGETLQPARQASTREREPSWRRSSRSLDADFEETRRMPPASAAHTAAARAAALAREGRRQHQPTPYFMRLHRGITAGMSRAGSVGMPSFIEESRPLSSRPEAGQFAALPPTTHREAAAQLCRHPWLSAPPLFTGPPPAPPPPLFASLSGALVTHAPSTGSGPPLFTPPVTTPGWVGTIVWRRSVYERNLYAQPTGAAAASFASQAHAAGAGGRGPSAARFRWGAGFDREGPVYSLKYVSGWIERELRALLMEEDVSIVCAFVQGLMRSHGLESAQEPLPASAPTSTAATSASRPSAPATVILPVAYRHTLPAPATNAAGGLQDRLRVFAGDGDFDFEDDNSQSSRQAGGALSSFEDGLRPFLGGRAPHFLHELRNFAASHLTVQAYDSAVVYRPASPAGPPSPLDPQAALFPHPLPQESMQQAGQALSLQPLLPQSSTQQPGEPPPLPHPIHGRSHRRQRGWDVGGPPPFLVASSQASAFVDQPPARVDQPPASEPGAFDPALPNAFMLSPPQHPAVITRTSAAAEASLTEPGSTSAAALTPWGSESGSRLEGSTSSRYSDTVVPRGRDARENVSSRRGGRVDRSRGRSERGKMDRNKSDRHRAARSRSGRGMIEGDRFQRDRARSRSRSRGVGRSQGAEGRHARHRPRGRDAGRERSIDADHKHKRSQREEIVLERHRAGRELQSNRRRGCGREEPGEEGADLQEMRERALRASASVSMLQQQGNVCRHDDQWEMVG